MIRKLFCAAIVLTFSVGVALADEFTAIITKVDGNKITFTKFDFKAKEKGEPMTLPAADNVKVVKGKFNKEEKKFETGDAIEGGLNNKMFKEIGEKGVFVRITTDDGKITQIMSTGFGGKKKKDGGN